MGGCVDKDGPLGMEASWQDGYSKSWHFFGCISWQAGSYFPKQGLNLCPLQCKHGVLTTGPSGKSLRLTFWFCLRQMYFLEVYGCGSAPLLRPLKVFGKCGVFHHYWENNTEIHALQSADNLSYLQEVKNHRFYDKNVQKKSFSCW